jgi:deoxycytidylate deaminase
MNVHDLEALFNLTSKCKNHEPKRKALIVAIAFCDNGKRLVAQNGADKDKNHEIHAEARMIKRAMKLYTKIEKLYVFRFDRMGNLRCAKPCERCMKKIVRFEVQQVFYSTDSGIKSFYV